MGKLWTALMLGIFVFCLSNVANAAVETKACAKYQKRDGSWSPAYRVKGFIISGKELNEQTQTHFYEAARYYYLITWRSGDFTIFMLNDSQTRLSASHQAYRDEEDRLWYAHEGWHPCH